MWTLNVKETWNFIGEILCEQNLFSCRHNFVKISPRSCPEQLEGCYETVCNSAETSGKDCWITRRNTIVMATSKLSVNSTPQECYEIITEYATCERTPNNMKPHEIDFRIGSTRIEWFPIKSAEIQHILEIALRCMQLYLRNATELPARITRQFCI